MTTQFDRFHNDLSAAIAAGAPIQLSESGRRITQKELDVTKEKMANHLAKTESGSLKHAISSVSNVQPRYQAGLQTFAQTQTMLPVFEGLTTQLLAEKIVAKALRHSLYYLFVLVAVTLFGLVIYSYKVVPVLLDVREDARKIANGNGPPMSLDLLSWVPVLTTILSVVLALMLIWFLLGGIKKLGMWVGGREYVRQRISHVAIRITQLLIDSGTNAEEAIELGCTLANCDQKGRGIVSSTFSFDSHLQDEGSVRRVVDYLAASANERLNYMRTAIPIAMVTVFGGLVTTAYCLLLFWPFVSLIWDVSNTTGGTQ